MRILIASVVGLAMLGIVEGSAVSSTVGSDDDVLRLVTR